MSFLHSGGATDRDHDWRRLIRRYNWEPGDAPQDPLVRCFPMLGRMNQSRPVLFWRGLRANRDRPDLAGLAAETDPERFVWRTLPHAARSFSASIVVLPESQARAAAVAYLYCRMLDTYEDLFPDVAERPESLRRFASRFEGDPMSPPDKVPDTLVRDDRDRLHLLLVDRCDLVDAVLHTFPVDTRRSIAELVKSMAEGMAWSAETLDRQRGVLIGQDQVARYCHHVIGEPALFVLGLVGGNHISQNMQQDALEVSEMIQLANITRDIERDLDRGVGYHSALKPYLKGGGDPEEGRETVRRVREEYLAVALQKVPAYRRLFDASPLNHSPGARMAAALMLLHTDEHYRRCAVMTGHEPWGPPRGKARMAAAALPALFSAAGARRVLLRTEEDFLGAAARIQATRPAG